MLFTPAVYPKIQAAICAGSSLDGAMIASPLLHHRDARPLPGLSSMLQQQRNPQDAPLLASSDHLHHGPRGTHLKCTSDHRVDQWNPNSTKYPQKDKTKPMLEVKKTAVATVPVKSSRYLREMDRRVILSRIEQGEKQSVLAKEYKVSRAAICNLNKHRDEVLSRKNGNPMAKHPKKPRLKTGLVKQGKSEGTETEGARLYAIQSRAVVLLLTTLRKKQANGSEFRRSSDRLMRIVMEEALAFVPVKTVEVFLPDRTKSDGVALEHPPCAISMEPIGYPMLDLFHLIEPDQPTGYVTFSDMSNSPNDAQTQPVHATICGNRLPTSLNYHNVFIFDQVVTSAEVVIAVVRRLQEHGAVVPMMSLVALTATQEVVDHLHGTFPSLKIVVAQIEDGQTPTVDLILDRMEQVYHGLSY